MSIGTPVPLGFNVPSPPSTGGTAITFALPSNVAVGDYIIAHVGWLSATGVINGASDNHAGGSLTWDFNTQAKNGSLGDAIVWAQAATARSTGDIVTINLSASGTSRGIGVCTVSGIASSSPVSGSFASNPGTNVVWTSGAVTPTAGDDVIVFGTNMADDFSDTSSAPTSPWLEVDGGAAPTAGDFNTTSNGDSFTMVYQLVTGASGSYTPAGQWALGGSATLGVAIAFKAAAGGGGGGGPVPTTIVAPSQAVVRSSSW